MASLISDHRYVQIHWRHCIPCIATNQDVRSQQLKTCQTTMVPRTGCARWLLRGICLAATWSVCRGAQHSHRVQHAGSRWQQRSHVIGCRQFVVQYDAEVSQTGHVLNVRLRWRQRRLPSRREKRSLSSCLDLALSCCPTPMLVDVPSHSGTCPLRRPAQPNRYHPQTLKFSYQRRSDVGRWH